mgnify:CR=1 FL=1
MDNGKNEIITRKLTVHGIVQGVGFRPLVYHLAEKYNIKGTVQNTGGLVDIITQSSQQNFDDFLYDLKTNKSRGYEIIKIDIEEMDDTKSEKYNDFKIIKSSSNSEIAIIPPDLPVCPECQEELFVKGDRRFLNPFISCMSCGPRYTIMETLPYDRHNTTMNEFPMCSDCLEEYTSPENRRFHAQTVSCNNCGPYLIFDDLTERTAFEKAVNIINDGGIIALKGVGGYHLACSPFKEDTVENLRKLKGREEKPFAVMFPSIESVREYCIVSKEEQELLESKARPIVLLYTRDKRMADSTNKDSIYCGAFLPYTGLQILITQKCGPLIMTSANISDKPIIKDDEEIKKLKSPYLDGILYNTRKIVRSVDDSVAKVIDNNVQLTRRSRGYVPYPVFISPGSKNIQIFASGGDLKAAYCIYRNGNAFVSQHFGDLEEKSIFDEYKNSVADLTKLLKIKPELAVCDMHPNYHSSRFTASMGIPVLKVQHHHAHIASVMAEHDLKEKVIGVAFDGTGYGTDGNIWGGEFLVCEGFRFERAAHLSYTPIIGGDKSMRDAKKTATCFLINSGLHEYIDDQRKTIIEAAVKNNVNTVLSSSMGRLFDAAASILNIQHENRYEGQCAINLEKYALLAMRNNVEPQKLAFTIDKKGVITKIDSKSVLESMCTLRKDVNISSIALGFHYAVADAILNVCEIIREKQNINTVALSGGVFQNTVLTERTLKMLREKGFKVYYNSSVPPNDGSISLGQTYIGLMR